MRTVLIALLLAGVASPALADDAKIRVRDGDRSEAREAREARSEARQERPDRSERSSEPRQRERSRSPDRSESNFGQGQQRSFDGGVPAGASIERVERVERRSGDTVRHWRQQPVEGPGVDLAKEVEAKIVRAPRRASRDEREVDTGDSVANWRRRERGDDAGSASIEERNLRRAPVGAGAGADGLVEPRRPLPRVFRQGERRVSRTPVFGTEPPVPRSASTIAAKPARHWRTDWRNDRRYDWRDHRRRHRNRFHFGFYYDPFGWDYFRYGIGWRLWPSYYRSSYWLRDPWEYRLPPAYGPYRWIRYHDDALLVNIYTGEVVDVVYNFFW